MAKRHTLHFQSKLPCSAEALCQWHCQPGVFERLIPPWERVQVLHQKGNVEQGGQLTMRVQEGPVALNWIARMFGYQFNTHLPYHQFEDEALESPFAYWHHLHRFSNTAENQSTLEDFLSFSLPLEPLSLPVGMPLVKHKLNRLFTYRHAVTHHDLSLHQRYNPGGHSMNIAVTGATGLVGTALVPFLQAGGHQVYRMVRKKPLSNTSDIYWNPETGEIDAEKLETMDIIIHLAGDNVADGLWSEAKKRRIQESRTKGTRLLSETLASLKQPPKAFVCASAIGYYGERGSEQLDEHSTPGTGFLTDVCVQWENATQPAKDAGIRTVNLRVGIVLTPKGSALGKMLPAFQLGGGGVLGDGKQYMSWIAIDDMVGAIYHAAMTDSLSGPANAVSPNPVTNHEFTKTLGKVICRPTLFPVPAFGIKMLFGEMGETLLLGSTRVAPSALLKSGFTFAYPNLEDALRHVLGKAR